jgi:AcrR family transcriptional regulator
LNQRTAQTRDRLLKAAVEVFSSAGIAGATTREIARVAAVNEVTLFRHFQSKEQLLSAVAEHITTAQTKVFADPSEWTEDLTAALGRYARFHDEILEEYSALVRMFIGEADRHPKEALQVLPEYFMPLRVKLIDYLQGCVTQGRVRADINLLLAVDQFTGMLFAGMLRRYVIPVDRGYGRDRYVESCVDLFVQHIQTRPDRS